LFWQFAVGASKDLRAAAQHAMFILLFAGVVKFEAYIPEPRFPAFQKHFGRPRHLLYGSTVADFALQNIVARIPQHWLAFAHLGSERASNHWG
jgi:hypothetical protein